MSDLAPDRLEASVVIPSFESHRTIARCLEALGRQSFRRFETIVVDSSPSDSVEEIVGTRFPWVRYERRLGRLLPHAARNVGTSLANGELLLFTDPDVYAEDTWIQAMVEAFEETQAVIYGAVACHGQRWVSVGSHLCKYDMWLPGGEPRELQIGPTVNMLCRRDLFDQLGGFPGELMLGDTMFSWRLAGAGERMWFAPNAVVHHDHRNSAAELLRERYERGREFGALRMTEHRWGETRTLLMFLVSVVPVRLMRLLGRGWVSARRAGLTGHYLWTVPLIAAGQAAWLAGEASAYSDRLRGHTRRD